MQKEFIMVVDDDQDLREGFAEAFELEGYKVLQAENGQKALDVLLSLPESSLPGCIMLDLMMPEMDGLTFLNLINKKFKVQLGQIPIVVASACCDTYEKELSQTTAVAQLTKPIDLDVLYDLVGRYCNKSFENAIA
jgi:CheY-like chemotaxis protein